MKYIGWLLAFFLVLVIPIKAYAIDWIDVAPVMTDNPIKPWTVTLTQDVIPSTVNGSTVFIKNPAGDEIAISKYEVEGKKITVYPKDNYPEGTILQLYLTDKIRSTQNKTMPSTRFSFVHMLNTPPSTSHHDIVASTTNEQYNGNVTVTGNGLTLHNIVVNGDLHITGSDMTLVNVFVKGNVSIDTAGETPTKVVNLAATNVDLRHVTHIKGVNQITNLTVYEGAKGSSISDVPKNLTLRPGVPFITMHHQLVEKSYQATSPVYLEKVEATPNFATLQFSRPLPNLRLEDFAVALSTNALQDMHYDSVHQILYYDSQATDISIPATLTIQSRNAKLKGAATARFIKEKGHTVQVQTAAKDEIQYPIALIQDNTGWHTEVGYGNQHGVMFIPQKYWVNGVIKTVEDIQVIAPNFTPQFYRLVGNDRIELTPAVTTFSMVTHSPDRSNYIMLHDFLGYIGPHSNTPSSRQIMNVTSTQNSFEVINHKLGVNRATRAFLYRAEERVPYDVLDIASTFGPTVIAEMTLTNGNATFNPIGVAAVSGKYTPYIIERPNAVFTEMERTISVMSEFDQRLAEGLSFRPIPAEVYNRILLHNAFMMLPLENNYRPTPFITEVVSRSKLQNSRLQMRVGEPVHLQTYIHPNPSQNVAMEPLPQDRKLTIVGSVVDAVTGKPVATQPIKYVTATGVTFSGLTTMTGEAILGTTTYEELEQMQKLVADFEFTQAGRFHFKVEARALIPFIVNDWAETTTTKIINLADHQVEVRP